MKSVEQHRYSIDIQLKRGCQQDLMPKALQARHGKTWSNYTDGDLTLGPTRAYAVAQIMDHQMQSNSSVLTCPAAGAAERHQRLPGAAPR